MKDYIQANNPFIIDELPVSYDKVQTQLLVEKMYNKKQQRNLLRKCFANVIEPIKDQLQSETIVLDILGILALRQEIYASSLVEMLVEKSQVDTSKKEIATAIVQAGTLGLFTGLVVNNNLKLVSKYSLHEDVNSILKQYQYLPPMIIRPCSLNQKHNNKGSGYLTIGSDSLILNNNHHTNDICIDTLEVLNSTELCLNIDVIKQIRNSWSNLDKPKEGETDEDYQQRVKAFEEFEKAFMKTSAYLVNQDNLFYLTHKFDKRGRIYCNGWTVSYQGNSYQKAVIEFKNKKPITNNVNWFNN